MLKMLKVVAGVALGALLLVIAYYGYKFDQGDPLPRTVKVRLASLSVRIEAFELNHARKPRILEELLQANDAVSGKPYAAHENLLDPWGTRFQYECVGKNCDQFTIISFGSDRKPGGDSHAADVAYDSATGEFVR